MFTTKTSEIFSYIKENPDLSLLVAKTMYVEQLLIQNLERDNIIYLSLRNIVVVEEHRRTGLFTDILIALEETNRPILIDDIKNKHLFPFLEKRKYSYYEYFKNNEKIQCMIKKV